MNRVIKFQPSTAADYMNLVVQLEKLDCFAKVVDFLTNFESFDKIPAKFQEVFLDEYQKLITNIINTISPSNTSSLLSKITGKTPESFKSAINEIQTIVTSASKIAAF